MDDWLNFAGNLAENIKSAEGLGGFSSTAGILSASVNFVSAVGDIAKSFKNIELEEQKLEMEGKRLEAELAQKIKEAENETRRITNKFEVKIAALKKQEKDDAAKHEEEMRRLDIEAETELEKLRIEDAKDQRTNNHLMNQENNLHLERMAIISAAHDLMKTAMGLSTCFQQSGYDPVGVTTYLVRAIETLQALSTLQVPTVRRLN